MAGTVNISRDLWDDTMFRDSEMSQREAFIWLVAEASWKPRSKRIGTTEVNLDRGQLAVSTRFLAKAWMWSEARVRRYLDMLEKRRSIQRKTDAGVTVITVCKYDKYQSTPKATDAPATRRPTHQRRTSDANEKKGEIRGNKEVDKSTSCPFSSFWSVWPHKVGKAAAEKAWRKLSEPDRAEVLERLRLGWLEAWHAHNPTANHIHASSFLNGKRWQDELRVLKAIPGGRNVPSNHSQHGTPQGRPNGADAALANIARIAGIGDAQG